jgi:hypothetical protein
MGEDFSWLDWFQRMAGNEQHQMGAIGSAAGGGLLRTGAGAEDVRYMPKSYFMETDPAPRREGWRGAIDKGVESVLGSLGVPVTKPGGNMSWRLDKQRELSAGRNADLYAAHQRQDTVDPLLTLFMDEAGQIDVNGYQTFLSTLSPEQLEAYNKYGRGPAGAISPQATAPAPASDTLSWAEQGEALSQRRRLTQEREKQMIGSGVKRIMGFVTGSE